MMISLNNKIKKQFLFTGFQLSKDKKKNSGWRNRVKEDMEKKRRVEKDNISEIFKHNYRDIQ